MDIVLRETETKVLLDIPSICVAMDNVALHTAVYSSFCDSSQNFIGIYDISGSVLYIHLLHDVPNFPMLFLFIVEVGAQRSLWAIIEN